MTRLLRELWIIGPLQKPGEGEREVEATIQEEMRGIVGILHKMRDNSRQELIDQGTGQAVLGQGSYTSAGFQEKGDTS